MGYCVVRGLVACNGKVIFPPNRLTRTSTTHRQGRYLSTSSGCASPSRPLKVRDLLGKYRRAPMNPCVNPDNPLRRSVVIAASFATLLWLLQLIGVVTDLDLYWLGVFPRTAAGLPGIVTAPLIHGSWQHLIGNTLPVLLLGSMLIYGYPRTRWWALAGIWLGAGLGVWLFARGSYHFGASGLAHGMFFYLFVGGILRRDKRSAALLMVAFYMYGGMLLTIFPREPEVSFESHFFGALAGTGCAWLFSRRDPMPPRRRYSWQDDADNGSLEEAEDPVIGDQWKT